MSNIQEWQEISREEVFRQFTHGIQKRIYRLPNGKEAEFYLKTGHESVTCFALTREQRVILVKQFRSGPAEILFELPGGGKSSNEIKEQAVIRELLEETGYTGEIRFVTELLPSTSSIYMKNFFFVATNCEKVSEPIVEENGEEVEVVLMDLDEFRVHIRTG